MNLYEEIQLGESRTLEFKESLPTEAEKWVKTVVAFANGAGGKIVVGVTDDRSVVGIPRSVDLFELKDAIANTVAQMCEPQIMFDITAEKIDDAQLLVIHVFPCIATPYYIKRQGRENGTYIRLGATTRNADWTALEELQFRGKRIFYDSLLNPEIKVSEEDVRFLCDEFSKRAKREITREDLINLRLIAGIEKDTATNACALFLGRHEYTSRIQCARFKGTTRTYFIDKKEFEGPLCSQIDGAYNFVLGHINMALEINGIVHEERYEIPVAAVRELIVNAVVHRNYQKPSSIQVAVYDDRVEVSSPGTLYGTLTAEEAMSGHSSLRNPLIARTLEKIGVIEGWGSGLKRISELCRTYSPGFRPLEILELGDLMRFNIYRPEDAQSAASEGEKSTTPKGDLLGSTTLKTTQKNDLLGNTSEELPNNFLINRGGLPNKFQIDEKVKSSGVMKTFMALKENPLATSMELAELLGLSDRSVRTHINELKNAGMIVRVGANKGGYWKIVEEPQDKA